MQYNLGPSIVSTVPGANNNGFPIDKPIVIAFDKDVAKSSISSNIQVIDRLGQSVECRFQYANKEIKITPREILKPNTSYTVIVHGDMNPNDTSAKKGIMSPTGAYMLGDYKFAFTTVSDILISESLFGLTPNQVVVTEVPSLKGETTCNTINPTKVVHIELSTSNTFEAGLIVWSGECDIKEFESGIKPNTDLFDGTYYWRARTCSDVIKLIYGDWSEIAQFAIEAHSDAKIVTSDHVDVDVAFPADWNMIEPTISEMYPQDGRSNVKTNLKTISIVFDQIVPEQVLESGYITLTGEPVDDDINNEGHGEVVFITSVIYDHEAQTTTIVISLPELGGE